MRAARTLLPILAFLVGGVSAADLFGWQIRCGIAGPTPYGSDMSTRFGVDQDGTWDYDGRDAVHPPVADRRHDHAFIYSDDYPQVFVDEGIGWPPPWKPWIDGLPEYPSPGLVKDAREPILAPSQPEFWLVEVYAPNDGETFWFRWEVNLEHGFEIPLDMMQVKIWGNPDLEAVGIEGDLDLLAYGPGQYVIWDIPQFGYDEEQDQPIMHHWIIEARMIPEPGGAAIVVLGCAALGALKRRK